MSSNNESAKSGGIGLMGLLFILLLALKLLNVTVVATWSWWWVTAPLWAPTGLYRVRYDMGALRARQGWWI